MAAITTTGDVGRGTLAPPFIATLSAIALCGVAPLLLVSSAQAWSSATPWPWAVVVMVWSGARLAWLTGLGRPYLYSVTFWIFAYVFLGVAPLLQMSLGVDPSTTPGVDPDRWGTAIGIVLVGLLAAEVGQVVGHLRPSVTREGREISRAKTVLLSLGAFVFVAFVASRTGLGPYFVSRDALVAARTAVWPDTSVAAMVYGAALALPLVSVHALVRHRRRRVQLDLRSGLFHMTVLMVAVQLATVNPISSPRIIFGTVLLSLVVLLGAVATPARTRTLIVALLVGFIFLFPAADAFRHTEEQQTTAPHLSQLAESGDYDAFAQITNTVTYVDSHGLTGGRQAVGVTFFWVPRSVWADKPTDTGVLLAENQGYRFTNLSVPLWAEAYINWGWTGVVLVMCGIGYLLQRGDVRMARALGSHRAPAIAGAILPFFLLIVFRGSLLQATGPLVLLLLAMWWVRAGRKSSPAQ